MLRWRSLVLVLVSCCAAACSGDGGSNGGTTDADDSSGIDTAEQADADTTSDDSGDDAPDGSGDTTDPGPTFCDGSDVPARPFDAVGPFGTHRQDLAADFIIPLVDGSLWTLSEEWTGCDSYVFLPDTLQVTPLDSTSLWLDGVAALVAASPHGVHYFFVPRRGTSEQARAAAAEMQSRIDDYLATLAQDGAERWRDRLHVVDERAGDLGAWWGPIVQSGIGMGGLAIDRLQRVRGLGSLADVDQGEPSLQGTGALPYRSSLAYAANEARYFAYEARREAELDAYEALVVPFWDGEVVTQFADVEIQLPSAEELGAFDTVELDVLQQCPDADAPEAFNCGAWDYLAHLWLFDGEGEEETRIELARLITTYHREGRWIVDVTPALHLLREGGTRRFRWDISGTNDQPTVTRLSLRFSNRGKGYRPIEVAPLWGGRAFDSHYNDDRVPIDVDIPADAVRVELRAVITGHGMAFDNCAEFCNHQHEFVVGGRSFVREHGDTVGDTHGCMNQIDQGVVPNQSGTWWYGRGGWCPGQQVDPWVVDVTELATPGEPLRVDYFGLYQSRTPPDGAGNIVLTSEIVSYGASD